MLYDCVADHGAGRPKAGRRPGSSLTVDIHCHVHTPAADALIPDRDAVAKNEPLVRFSTPGGREIGRRFLDAIAPKLTSVPVRLSEMDAAGIDVQAISPSPFQYYYWADPEVGRETCRLVNDNLAAIAAAHPDRFVAMGIVPLQDVGLAIAELERMVSTLGMRGVEISTVVNGVELDDARFRPFFQKAEELGILVFVHPAGFSHGDRLTEFYLNNTIGQPLEEAIALARLAFSGALAALPRLKMCIAHGGGYLPAYAGRMDHAYRVREDCRCHIDRPPSEYLKQLYFDSVVFDPDELGYLIDRFGSDRVLLGTDYPYDMSEPDPLGLVGRVDGLGRSDIDAICGLNAARLLNLDVAALVAQRRR